MITSVTLLVLSLFALYIGAGWLVKGSTEIALKAKISNLVIGLTIVAFGTSAPELVVSLNASLSGQGDIAVGNIIGSNIFNIAAILGISAAIQPLQAKRQLTRLDIPILIVATAVFTLLFWNGVLGRLEGCFFLAGIIIYTVFSLYYSRKHEKKVEEQIGELEKQPEPWYKDVLYIVGGLVILIFASNLLVNNAVSIAQELGVSEAVIGLTIVAGTGHLGRVGPQKESGYCDREYCRFQPVQYPGYSGNQFCSKSDRCQKRQLRRPAGYAGINPAPASTGEKRTKDFTCRRVGAYTCVFMLPGMAAQRSDLIV